MKQYVHPFINFFLSWAREHPGQVTCPSQGHMETKTFTLSLTPQDRLKFPDKSVLLKRREKLPYKDKDF